MSIFETLGKPQQTNTGIGNGMQNPQQMFTQLKSNPIAMLKQAGYNVPENLADNPMAMIQHLVNSGQIPKSRLQMFARK